MKRQIASSPSESPSILGLEGFSDDAMSEAFELRYPSRLGSESAPVAPHCRPSESVHPGAPDGA
jgi:hypothetical protein